MKKQEVRQDSDGGSSFAAGVRYFVAVMEDGPGYEWSVEDVEHVLRDPGTRKADPAFSLPGTNPARTVGPAGA